MANEQQDNLAEESKVFYSWNIDERMQHERSFVWYISMTIIGAVLIAYSIFTANFLLAIIVIIVAFIVIIRDYLPAKRLNFAIANNGVFLGRKFYPYRNFKSFYVIYEPPTVQKLYFEFKGYRPDLSIELGENDPIEIRNFLLNVLAENLEREDESGIDFVERFLKL